MILCNWLLLCNQLLKKLRKCYELCLVLWWNVMNELLRISMIWLSVLVLELKSNISSIVLVKILKIEPIHQTRDVRRASHLAKRRQWNRARSGWLRRSCVRDGWRKGKGSYSKGSTRQRSWKSRCPYSSLISYWETPGLTRLSKWNFYNATKPMRLKCKGFEISLIS